MSTTDTTIRPSDELVALRSIEIMGNGTMADFEEIVHPNFVNHEARDEPPACRGAYGPAALFATAQWLQAAFAELRWEIHEVVCERDLVVIHCTMRGRHVGPFVAYAHDASVEQAFPPTGAEFASTQSHWVRIADGKMIEHWANRDDMGTAKQLGWIPPTPVYLLRMALAERRAVRAARRG